MTPMTNAVKALIAERDELAAENARLREALGEIDRRCTAWATASPSRNLVGVKQGTIRNVGAIARAALDSKIEQTHNQEKKNEHI